MKKTEFARPYVVEEQQRPQGSETQERARKTSRTIQQKKTEAFQFEERPFNDDAARFGYVSQEAAKIVTGHNAADAKEMTDEERKEVDAALKANKCAFALVPTKDGGARFPSNLSRLEARLVLVLMNEFVTQSKAFAASLAAAKDDSTQRVKIGQNGDDFTNDLQKTLLAKYGVSPRDIYFDDKFRFCKDYEEDENGKTFFEREDGVKLYVYEVKDVDGVETFFCFDKETNGTATVRKHNANKFVFLNASELSKKYFRSALSGGDFARLWGSVLTLGQKTVLFRDTNGTFKTSPFFTTHVNFGQYGRDDFALLIMNAPVFAGLEAANKYVKLPQLDEILADASDVELRLLLTVGGWRLQKRGKVSVQKFNGQELFEMFGAADEVKQRRFVRFWPKLREALLRLIDEHELLSCTVDDKRLTADTNASTSSHFVLAVSKKLERHAPALAN